MENPQFRHFMGYWLEKLGLWSTPFDSSGSITARDCGRHEAALEIWNSLSRTQQSRLILEENDGNPRS